jgi:hypothetical protein
MRKLWIFVAGFAAAATLSAGALAAVPFPSANVTGVFVGANTVTPAGLAANLFAPGSTVVFRASAVDLKTHKPLVANGAKYFYVAIPNQPNVKMKYDPKAAGATSVQPWTGSWVVPASYPAGIVNFKVLVKTTAKRIGSFVQFPVTSAQLTIKAAAPAGLGAPPAAVSSALPATEDVSLYVDSVNGTRPAAAAPRAFGCTQTNVYKRGEQFVLRAWGANTDGSVLSTDNVDSAVASIPGQADLKLTWGAHGTDPNKVFFWSSPWDIPTSYPLGDAVIKVTFKTDSGKVGTYDYAITITP